MGLRIQETYHDKAVRTLAVAAESAGTRTHLPSVPVQELTRKVRTFEHSWWATCWSKPIHLEHISQLRSRRSWRVAHFILIHSCIDHGGEVTECYPQLLAVVLDLGAHVCHHVLLACHEVAEIVAAICNLLVGQACKCEELVLARHEANWDILEWSFVQPFVLPAE